MERLLIPAGIVVGIAFVVAVLIRGMSYPEAVAWLLITAVLSWVFSRSTAVTLRIFATAIIIVALAWGIEAGAFGA